MILELADLRIRPGGQADFDRAIQRGLTEVVSTVPGYRGHEVHKGIESPERYLLMIYWDSVEAHTEGFRQSQAFTDWRAIVGPHFAEAPKVDHYTLLTRSA
jgi:heme-degrading monooxygenase HmoA